MTNFPDQLLREKRRYAYDMTAFYGCAFIYLFVHLLHTSCII